MDSIPENDTAWLVERLNDEKAHVLLPAMAFLGVLMALGVVGNALVIFYYGWRAKTTTGTFFILTLAIFDLLGSAIGIPIEISDMMFFYTFENVLLCKTLVLVNHFSIVASAFTLTAIAVDRYRRIVRPFGRQITMRQAKVTCATCVGLGVLLGWPASIFYGVRQVDILNSYNLNITGYDCTTEKDEALLPYSWAYGGVQFVGFGGVTITLLVAYLLVGRQLYRHRQYKFYVAQRSLRELRDGRAGDTAGSGADDSTEPRSTTLQTVTDSDSPVPSPHMENLEDSPFDEKDEYVEVEYEGPDLDESPTPQPERIPDLSELLGCVPSDSSLPEVETPSTPTRAFGFLGLIHGKTASILTNLSGRSSRSIVIWNISDEQVCTVSEEDIANARTIPGSSGDDRLVSGDKRRDGSHINLRQLTGSATEKINPTSVRTTVVDSLRQCSTEIVTVQELDDTTKTSDLVNGINSNSETTKDTANISSRHTTTNGTNNMTGVYRKRTSSTSSASTRIRRARRDNNNAADSADDKLQTNSDSRPASSGSFDAENPSDKRFKMLDINTVKYTVIMLIIAVVFILSMLPYLGLWWVWRIFAPDDFVYTLSDAQLVWLQIGIRSYFINGAVNPLIYGLFNSQFRTFFYNAVCGVCSRKRATITVNNHYETNSKDSPKVSGTDSHSSFPI